VLQILKGKIDVVDEESIRQYISDRQADHAESSKKMMQKIWLKCQLTPPLLLLLLLRLPLAERAIPDDDDNSGKLDPKEVVVLIRDALVSLNRWMPKMVEEVSCRVLLSIDRFS